MFAFSDRFGTRVAVALFGDFGCANANSEVFPTEAWQASLCLGVALHGWGFGIGLTLQGTSKYHD
jgi:hypothetical protein